MSTIAVVGCGIAGDEAAFEARRSDPKAQIVLLTEEPHPLYSACVLGDYVGGEIERKQAFLRGAEEYENAGVDLQLSRQVAHWSASDHRLYLESGGELAYDRLILATGSRPQLPSIPGVATPGVFALKTMADADRLKNVAGRSAVVVGTGLVGVEAAVALRKRGFEVSLLGRRERVLPRLFDAPVASVLEAALEQGGVRTLLGEQPLAILGGERVRAVQTDRRRIEADVVVFALGMTPEVSLAREGGVGRGKSGAIRVDAQMRTNIPGVWACGDCVESRNMLTGQVGSNMLWNNARQQGRVAGAGAAGGEKHYPGSLNITTVHAFDRVAASVGTPAAEHGETHARLLHRDGNKGGLTLVAQGKRLVGAQVLDTTERLGELLGPLLRGGDMERELMRVSKSPLVRPSWARGAQGERLVRWIAGEDQHVDRLRFDRKAA